MKLVFVSLLQLLLICIRFAFAVFVSRMGDGKAFVFDKFLAPCSETRRPIARFENVTFISQNEYLNYDLVLSKKLSTIYMEWQLTRCATKEALDTCVPITTLKTPNVCGLMLSKDDLWSPMLLCSTPVMKCPMGGVYHGKNCTLSMKAFKLFPLMKSFWKVKVVLYSRKDFVFCTMMEGAIQKYG